MFVIYPRSKCSSTSKVSKDSKTLIKTIRCRTTRLLVSNYRARFSKLTSKVFMDFHMTAGPIQKAQTVFQKRISPMKIGSEDSVLTLRSYSSPGIDRTWLYSRFVGLTTSTWSLTAFSPRCIAMSTILPAELIPIILKRRNTWILRKDSGCLIGIGQGRIPR